MKELINQARSTNVISVFAEKQISSVLSEAITDEIGAKAAVINQLPNNYLENLIGIGDKLSLYLN